MVGGPAARLRPQDRTEPGPADIQNRSSRHTGLAKAKFPAPAVQQQKGAAGTAPHDGPGDVSRFGRWAVAILPQLLLAISLRQSLCNDDRCRADGEPRPRKGESTGQ